MQNGSGDKPSPINHEARMSGVPKASSADEQVALTAISAITAVGTFGASVVVRGALALRELVFSPKVDSIDALIQSAGPLQQVRGAQQGFVKGDAQQVFSQVTKGAQQVKSGAYRRADGTMVNMHSSTTTGVPTIDINRAGAIYKIRVIP